MSTPTMSWPRRALPSLVTLCGFACGLVVVLIGDDLDRGGAPISSALFVLAAIGFDMLDGVAARTLRAQSAFGRELDSLSDLVCFGVAPATLLHDALAPLHALGGALAAGLFAIATAVRLARFNVWSQRPEASIETSVGLTAPMGACALIALLLLGPEALGPAQLGAASAILALLMLSAIPYRTTKGARPGAVLAALAAVAAVGVGVALVEGPVAAFVTLALGYAASGPVLFAVKVLGPRLR